MNIFEQSLGEVFGEQAFARIQQITVGVAGLGGLGSNCAACLVRCGFRRFILCDHDTVEPENLNRQFYFLEQIGMNKTDALKTNLSLINPDLDITIVTGKVTEENVGQLFASCDVVVEAFDNVHYKELITRTYSRSGTFFVAASGLAGWADADQLTTRRIHEHFYLIGDCTTAVSSGNPPCAPRVQVAAAKQANTILQWAIG